MAGGQGEVVLEDEELPGDFLLCTDRLHDSFFVLGKADKGPTQRIGVVKACLMNHSRVFRNMLHDSHLAETGDITLPDIQPPIFRLLLKHCYGGLDNLRPLTREDTVLLCYAAEKYLMSSLKKKIAERLKPEGVGELFPALHCLVTYNVTDLEQNVTEIVREQTEKVFASEGFVNIDVNSLVFIVKQEVLNCQEIDVWKASVNWANHKAKTTDCTSTREWLTLPLRHLRLMTLSYEDLCKDVLAADVLTYDEFCQVCARRDVDSGAVCGLKEPRRLYQERWKWWETVTVTHENKENRWTQADTSYSCLVIGDRPIMLESITCLGSTAREFHDSYGLSYPCQAEVQLSRITDYISSTSSEDPVLVSFNGNANYYEQFTIPTLLNGESIPLKINSMYKLKITFLTPELSSHPCWKTPRCSEGHTFNHGKFYCSYIYEDGIGWKPSHVVKFQYSYRR